MTLDPNFDPDDTGTWPLPGFAVHSRRGDGRPRRVSEYGEGWQDGFDLALEMAEKFHETGEWWVP